MSFLCYCKDRFLSIIISFIAYFLILLILFAFKVDSSVILSITFILFLLFILLLLYEYFRKRKFYQDFIHNISLLDKAYLVLETLKEPDFYEGKIIYDSLYEINKSMLENVSKIEEQWHDFKEYIEMWIHEVKVPLSAIQLMEKNHKDLSNVILKRQLKKIEDAVEQVLYYVRCENAEKDYLIKEVDLSSVIKNVGLKNMDDLLENKIDFIVDNVHLNVLTDSKWLEFILNQIINNSIKYQRKRVSSYIKIYTRKEENTITLIIEDNGIGIKESDLEQVFDKSFTGENGRKVWNSTGMGLYIAKSMCLKLGHKISIDSKVNQYTKVMICFSNNTYFDVLK